MAFLNNLVVNEVYFEHNERIEGSWSGDDRGVFAQISHKPALFLQDYIRISGRIAFGIDSRLRTSRIVTESTERSWNFGVEGALSVRITL